MIVAERLLQRVQLGGVGRDALDREEIVPVRLDGEHEAGAHGQAVDQDGAGAAHAMLASQMRAGEAELVAQEIGERETDLDLFLIAGAVDGERDLAFLVHR